MYNLLSISKLTKAFNCVALFLPSFCVLHDLPTRKLIGTGELRDSVHYFKQLCISFTARSIQACSAGLWHQCLRQLSLERLSLVPELSAISFKDFPQCCDFCHRAKQTSNVFPLSSNKS